MKSDIINRRRFLAGTATSCLAASTLGRIASAQDPLPDNVMLPGPDEETAEKKFIHPAMHYKKLDEQKVECQLCPHRCEVADLERGTCGVRENRGGTYYTLVHSRACAVHADPIEKKPLFHFLPGTQALSIATAGCNMECKFCQNWNISQFRPEQLRSWYMPPERLLDLCGQYRCRSLAFTYSEPVIFYEYMYDASAHVKPEGIHPVMISNGFIEPEPMKQLAPYLSAVKIDLKAFTEKFYDETCGGHLQPVLDTLVLLKELGLWFEIVVLIVPTLNDGEEETRRMCGWIHKNLGPDVPLHFSRYHPTYKIQNIPPTPLKTLEQHHAIAIESGLHYVYLGNLPGHQSESTCCPACGKVVIGRYGYHISSVNLSDGKCSHCSHPIAGVWV